MLPGGNSSRFSRSGRPASASNSPASILSGCGVLGRRDQVAARDYFEIAVAKREAVQVVENLHVVFVAFSMVDGIFMLPMVVVLVETKRPDAARRDVERGMAVVIGVANGGGAAGKR